MILKYFLTIIFMSFQDAGDMIQQIANEIFPFQLRDLRRLLALS